MGNLEKLINELCPNGVEYKKIPDIADTFIGLVTTMTKHYVEKGVPLIHNSDIKQGKFEFKEMTYLDEEFALKNENRRHKLNDVITVHTGDVGTSAIINEELDGSLGFATIVSRIRDFNVIIPEFLCVFLNSHKCKAQINSMIKGDRNNLNLKDFNNIILPVPPLEVQCEIVHILDDFTELSAELMAEQNARRIQYEYYRDNIFNNLDKYTKFSLGDIVEFINGRAYKQEELLDSGKYKVLRVGNFGTNGRWYYSNLELEDDKYCNKGDLLYLWSASFGPQIWENEKTIFHYHIWKLRFNETEINKEFLFYFLDYDKENLKSLTTNSTMPHISMTNMKTRNIYLPPIEIQRKIVKYLNAFYTLVNSNLSGLPAEIEARQKQYEYYRNKLLTFKNIGE